MAFQVDEIVNHTPPQSPLAMPEQSLEAWQQTDAAAAMRRPSAAVHLARLFVFGLAGLLTAAGTYGMYEVISPVDVTWLQVVFAALFALTFTWISFSCASAIVGFVVLLRNAVPAFSVAAQKDMGRTALLMPVYNENPEAVFATLERMGRSLVWQGMQRHFDIFILSDTRKDEVAAQEQECFKALRKALHGEMGIYYRRRADNHHRKAGNIADFVKRWGKAYDHMIVLDADSEMSGEILVALAGAMAADPKAGIIQSLPLLRNRWTPYARMTQFAGRVYGPVVATGLAAWHGRDGNYWGHNAIIRTRAFAEAGGLPELKGRKPFGGHILSHDFIEAALLRRAGWAVYMLPQLRGSYEETPPSLIDLAARDRRWAQGNLQHMKILNARGLHWVSRVHLLQGIMSYLASPLWFLLLVAGMGLALVARYTEPNYFGDGFSLFPAWPVFDPELALRLLMVTGFVLYLPKVLGLILALRDREVRKGCGGTMGLLKSVAMETFLSMLLSPVMMLVQSRFVLDVVLGRDSGWNTQNRDDAAIPFAVTLRRHWGHATLGVLFCCASFAISWATFLWFLPIVAGLMLSPVVSWATGNPELGRRLWRANVFCIPEETPRQVELMPEQAPVAILHPAE
ncbi:MAG: glucans biosynthesis glucosyltransferase MdoH [Rhizobiales bacterium]|nr:glucans biosynthesis glucosyltransferase MdoH [Hyphomicrobiales bacterium]